jgi:hypothetical protein
MSSCRNTKMYYLIYLKSMSVYMKSKKRRCANWVHPLSSMFVFLCNIRLAFISVSIRQNTIDSFYTMARQQEIIFQCLAFRKKCLDKKEYN